MPTAEPAINKDLSSIVITVKNEGAHIAQLLESLARQDPPFEILIVDAFSDDNTYEIAREFASKHPGMIRLFQKKGKRGAGRNFGVANAKGARIFFIDGDCVADSHWLLSLKAGFTAASVVAGQTTTIGNPSYAKLERVELFQGGMDVTYPSCNLAYEKELFDRLGGFDEGFVTAEDIDLNLRAVRSGAAMVYERNAIVYHTTRMGFYKFLIQAFWNGYGRKQLTEKHGQMWSRYRYRRMLSTQKSPLAYVRLIVALSGYFARLVTGIGSRATYRKETPDNTVTAGATKG